MTRRATATAHDEYRSLAAASVDGRLDPEGTAMLSAHLAECAACRADQAAMIADHAWLSEPASPAWPRAEVRRYVLDAARAPRVPATAERGRTWTAIGAAAAVVVLIGVVAIGSTSRLQFGVAGASASPSATPPGGSPMDSTPTQVPLSASPVPRVGDPLSIWPAPATFPAGQPFFLSHGYCFESTDPDPIASGRDPNTRVDYYIDGVLRVALRETLVPEDGSCLVRVQSVANVTSGLPPGIHHFTGLWYVGTRLDQTREADIRFE